jgi:hypothetical protein
MHEPISSYLEHYLTRSSGTQLPASFTTHLVACAECREELSGMEAQSDLVRVLRPERELDPSPGFYARVLERLEAHRPISIWSVFFQPFGRKLAMASLALVLTMGAYLLSTEPGDERVVATSDAQAISALPGEDQPGLVLGAKPEHGRGSVFVDLATYREQ